VQPSFHLSAENARTIAEICARLDGLPLALELAAARLKLLPPQALLARLGQRLALLTGGGQDAPARQQTLRQTLAWSYDLLSPQEQRLFRRLAVFVGGWSIAAVEAICQTLDGQPVDALEGLASLLDKSLVRQTAEQNAEAPRFRLLETIREYALERLAEAGETEVARQSHAAYYLALAEEARPHLQGAEQGRWFDCLEAERENFRATLAFEVERARKAQTEGERREYAEQSLRLCTALIWFWDPRMYYREGVSFLEQALALSQDVDPRLRMSALSNAGSLYSDLDDYERAVEVLEESLTLSRALGDRAAMASALLLLGGVDKERGRYTAARTQLEEAASLFLELGDSWSRGFCLTILASLATAQGDYTRAHALLEEAHSLYRTLGDRFRMALVLFMLAHALFMAQADLPRAAALAEESLALYQAVGAKAFSAAPLGLLGEIAQVQGEPSRARKLAEAGVAILKEAGSPWDTARVLGNLAHIVAAQGDLEAACALYQESLAVINVYTNSLTARCLDGLASVVAAQGSRVWAARLWGAADALRQRLGAAMEPFVRINSEQAVAASRAALGEHAFSAAWAEGRTLTPEQALAALGLPLQPKPIPSARPAAAAPNGLTAREVEVLRLVTQGLTDAQIAERLVISPRTVNNHLTAIYSKLAVSSRAAATRYAIERHLG
jgi:ATP/maltotriose-dependent transcriptional regulator MalT